jgi:hypothetical protein
MLGGRTINSFTEESDGAKIASNLWETVRDDILRSHPWNCAVKRVVLAPDTEAPAYDWTAAFTLPGDFLRLLSVGEYDQNIDFRLEGGKILCDESALPLRYIFRNENTVAWDAALVNVMTYAMAAAMAYGITQSASMVDMMTRKLEMAKKSARAVDGSEDPGEESTDYALLSSRSR